MDEIFMKLLRHKVEQGQIEAEDLPQEVREQLADTAGQIKHFIAGAIASIVVYVVTFNVTIALTFSVLLGVGKEVYDSRGHGTVEVLDAVATVLGGVVGIILIKTMM